MGSPNVYVPLKHGGSTSATCAIYLHLLSVAAAHSQAQNNFCSCTNIRRIKPWPRHDSDSVDNRMNITSLQRYHQLYLPSLFLLKLLSRAANHSLAPKAFSIIGMIHPGPKPISALGHNRKDNTPGLPAAPALIASNTEAKRCGLYSFPWSSCLSTPKQRDL
jgi:hypothetical protein